jgi:signal transduction histidine kinase
VVSLVVRDDILLTVGDDGVGFAEQSGRGSGLANLEQRAVALGGSCEVVSVLGEGTTVTWRLPYPIDDDGGRDH